MTLWSELKTARPSLLELASKHDDVMMLVLRMLVLVLASKHNGDGGYGDDFDDN